MNEEQFLLNLEEKIKSDTATLEDIRLYEKVIYQHQEQPNEEYFECESEYLNGTWC